MTGRERFLRTIRNEKPDRLPCQVHEWMAYYLRTYLRGTDQWGAYDAVGMDPVIYIHPKPVYGKNADARWKTEIISQSAAPDGSFERRERIVTPDGILHAAYAGNQFTGWMTEHPIKTMDDFAIWERNIPVPERMDYSEIIAAKERLGDRGITRGSVFDFGQGSPWQSYCYLRGTVEAIMDAMDEPKWTHHVMQTLLNIKLGVLERSGKVELDLVETGGGAGSSTVISPALHREFCLPYDKIQIEALHCAGTLVVYHLCGGLMPLLETVAENGADALETMTPPGMGGDCDLAEATRRVGDKLCFIGGFDQGAGFERGTPADIRRMVQELHESCLDGGYIVSPSDHFFFGDPENVRAFAETARACVY